MGEYIKFLKQDSSSKSIRIVGRVVSVMVIAIIAFFIYGQFFTTPHILLKGDADDYNTGWIIDRYDGLDSDVSDYNSSNLQSEATLPVSIPVKGSGHVILHKPLEGKITADTYLCLLNRWDIDIYVGDEIRYSFSQDVDEINGGYVKSHYILVPIYTRDAGSEVRIVRNYHDSDATVEFNTIYYGTRSGIFYLLIERFGPQFFSACSLLIISIMIIIAGFILLIIYRRKMPLIILGFGSALAALWFIFDSFLYQVLFNNYFVDGPMEYLLIMVFPYYYIRYLNYEQKRRYEKYYMILCAIITLNCVIMSILHFSGIRSFENNLIFTSLNILILGLTFVFTIIIDVISKDVQDYPIVAIGFSLVVLFGIIQIIVLNMETDNHDALILLLGMHMLLVCGVANTIMRLRHIEDVSRRQKHISELKSNFLANMSHEIRTPVNAILGMNEMILHESTEDEIKGYSGNIKAAGDTLLDIINDILDFSKIESGKMVLVNEDYKLADMLVNLYNMISIKALDKDLTFKVELDPTIPGIYHGDDKKLQQVLINLLNNAVKYTSKGSVTFRISINKAKNEEMNEAGKSILHFEVADTGIGIREEDMDKLFETFERIDLKKNRSIEGTGLGLSISNNLVKLMGGTLTVESKYSEGSVFIIDIPQDCKSDTEIGEFDRLLNVKSKDDKTSVNFTAPDANIMVVDDVKMNIRVIKGLVKRHNIRVTEVLSGPECINNYADSNVDMILLDHMMPEMDGIETLHLLREQNESMCPVVVLTANAISGMREMYLSEGFDDYLSKPTKPADLDEILLKYLPREKIIFSEE